MAADNKKSEQKNISNENAHTGASAHDGKDATVEVLYQNLGGRWYAFSIIDDEVFMGSINPESIDPMSIGN